jgi:hypothetical protein
MTKCPVCEWPRLFRAGLCEACYRHRRRHGKDRTPKQVEQLWERRLAPARKRLVREQEQALIRTILLSS